MSTKLQKHARYALIAGGLMLILGSPLVLAQTVYRWVNDAGQMHFSHTPPPEGEAEEIEKNRHSGPVSSAPVQADPKADAFAETKRLREEALAERAKLDALAAEDAAYRREVCAAATSRLAQWRNNNPRVQYKQEDGSSRRYLPEELSAKTAEDEQKVRDNC